MKLAGEAGSLLKVDEEIGESVTNARRSGQSSLREQRTRRAATCSSALPKWTDFSAMRTAEFDFSDISNDQFWSRAEDWILDALRAYAEHATNGQSVLRTLFREDTAQGFAFVDLSRNKYDVVLMNPPFGASSTRAKTYIDATYPRTKGDLLANFIERTLGWISPDGLVGAISCRTPFYLGSSDELRTEVLGPLGAVQLLADLGDGVLDATVEVAIYVLVRPKRETTEAVFFRELIEQEKESSLASDVDAVAGRAGWSSHFRESTQKLFTPFWSTLRLLGI